MPFLSLKSKKPVNSKKRGKSKKPVKTKKPINSKRVNSKKRGKSKKRVKRTPPVWCRKGVSVNYYPSEKNSFKDRMLQGRIIEDPVEMNNTDFDAGVMIQLNNNRVLPTMCGNLIPRIPSQRGENGVLKNL